jgi:hypothetical protein
MKQPAATLKKGSVLVIVLVTLVITAFALTTFLDKASTDLIVAARDADNRRLRQEAYSALEVTLDVLSCFNQTVGALRSPSEGWGDPLTFANYTPSAGRTVEVAFEDESGKLSLPNVNSTTLLALFQLWNMTQPDAQRLTDALLGWMKPNYAPTGTFTPDYDQAAIPYAPPGRSLRSFDELASIDVARDVFYGEDGLPNDLWRQFVADFSLLNFRQPNLNGVRPDVLAALGGFEATQQQNLDDFVNGNGNYQNQGPSYFRNVRDAAAIIGQGDLTGFTTQISALRIIITVHDGRAAYRLNAVVTIPGAQAAQTVQSSATNSPSGASATTTGAPAANSSRTTNAPTTAGAASPAANNSTANGTAGANGTTTPPKLNYPFTVLEIHENDEPIPVAPPPPPAE